MLRNKDRVRFWSKVAIQGIDDCWEWLISKDAYGYGQFSIKHKMYKAHRIIFREYYGDSLDISDPTSPKQPMTVMHDICDNPGCVNPAHLRLGTHKENHIDKKLKSRSYKPTGEKHPKAKLNKQQVIEIKERYTGAYGEQTALANEYNVDFRTINYIVNNKIWKHI